MYKYSIVIFLLIIPSIAFAGPFSQISNMLEIPEAYGIQHLEAKLGTSGSYFPNRAEKEFEMDYKLSMGVMNWSVVGITVYNGEYVAGHFQVGLPIENEWGTNPYLPVISVGIENISGEKYLLSDEDSQAQDRQNNSVYIVASKDFSYFTRRLPLELHVGYGNGRFQKKGSDNISDFFQGVFLGIRYKPNDYFHLILEEDGKDINAGMSLNIEEFTFSYSLLHVDGMFRKGVKEPMDELKTGFALQYKFDLMNIFQPRMPTYR